MNPLDQWLERFNCLRACARIEIVRKRIGNSFQHFAKVLHLRMREFQGQLQFRPEFPGHVSGRFLPHRRILRASRLYQSLIRRMNPFGFDLNQHRMV